MDVVVIGAGIIGVAIADALALRGARVTVLEMRSPGRGASQASAGVLAPYIEGHGRRDLLQLCARSFGMYDAFVEALRDRTRRGFEYRRCGTIEAAMSDAEAEHLQAQGWIGDPAVQAQWLEPAEVREIEPAISSAAAGGLLIRSHALVDVRGLLGALASSARTAGAVFESPLEVSRITTSGTCVEVRAGDRSYVADHVVIAAGCWSSRLRVDGSRLPPVRPVRGQLLHVQWTGRRPPASIVWGRDCYVVPWSDGTVLVGATVEDAGFEESVTVEGAHQLTTAVSTLLPESRTAVLREIRVGLRPAGPDDLPIVGPLPSVPNVTLATAHYRNGILLAPLTAALVSDYVLTGQADPLLQMTSPSRFDRVAEGASS